MWAMAGFGVTVEVGAAAAAGFAVDDPSVGDGAGADVAVAAVSLIPGIGCPYN